MTSVMLRRGLALRSLSVLGVSLVLAGCAGGGRPGLLRPEPSAGLSYAASVCGPCHGVRQGEASPNPAAPPFGRIAGDYSDYGLDLEFDAIARMGHFAMPPLTIAPSDRRALKAYLLYLKARQQTRPD